MKRDRSADDIFSEALEFPREERARFLSEACTGDAALRAEVDSLLASHDRAGEFLRTPAIDARIPDLAERDKENLTGRRVGDYHLLKMIGTGGMSTVYLGERADADFEQHVAVKLIRRGMDTEDILRRFRNERRVLAGLEHPHIARLVDGGATEDGRPFLVTEFVDGLLIDHYCRDGSLSLEGRLELFRTVCGAVHFAHRNLVVHRDIKPGNILVTREGEVKLLDFGIAKVLEPGDDAPGGLTATGIRVMTPRYASPEQVLGEPVTTATDVYSLGVVLYELLTGEPPYHVESEAPSAIEKAVCETTPLPPSTVAGHADSAGDDHRRIARRLSGDLDNIVLKALRKEPERRYASAEQFSEDIKRHLSGLPVIARPDTLRYRTAKFVRRNRALVITLSALFLTLIAATAISTSLFMQASRSRDLAIDAQAESEAERERSQEINRFLSDMLSSVDPDRAQGRDTELLREVLDGAASRLDRELGDRPDLAWSLHQTIGSTYLGLGLNDESEYHHRRSMELLQEVSETRSVEGRVRDEDARNLALISAGLASAVGGSGRYAEAESLLLAALSRPMGSGPEDRTALANVVSNLAVCLDRIGKVEEAERRYREAVDLRTDVLGPSHWELAISLSELGRFLTLHDKREEAHPVLLQSVEMFRQYEVDHPTTAALAYRNLGEWYQWERRYDEAEPLYREAFDILSRYVDANHPSRMSAMVSLAGLLEYTERYAAAEPLYREALDTRRRVLGNDHAQVGTTANNLAGLLRKTGRYEEADRFFQEAAGIYSRALGPDHAWVAIAKANHAYLYELMGNGPDAARTANEALEIGGQYWDEQHFRTAVARSILGAALVIQGRLSEAEPLLLKSLEILELDKGDDDPRTQQALKRVVTLYESRGDSRSSARYQSRIVGD